LAVYLLLKKKLNSLFFKIVFLKLIFLKKNKILVLVNIYKLTKVISNSNKRSSGPVVARGSKFNRVKTRPKVLQKTNKQINMAGKVQTLISTKLFSKKKKVKSQLRTEKAEEESFLVKSLFSTSKLKLRFFSFQVERFLSKILGFSTEVRLKNIFNFKAQPQHVGLDVLTLSKLVYKKAKTF
jgi:hypothetical protein